MDGPESTGSHSVVCLVVPRPLDRQLEKMLAGAGRLKTAGKPISEVNTQHDLIRASSVER
jgi:molecular chaperone HtpG